MKIVFCLKRVIPVCFLFLSCMKSVPKDMIMVIGGDFSVGDGISHAVYDVKINDFVMSRYEITNTEAAELYNWALKEKLVIVDHSVRPHVKSDIGTFYDLTQPRVKIEENAEWDLIDLTRPGGGIYFEDGIFKIVPGHENFPAVCLSWYGACAYCNFRSIKEGYRPVYLTQYCDMNEQGNGYRLPYGEEWEYAARGGRESTGSSYAGSNNAQDVGWFLENSDGTIHEVGQKAPNELGFYDMSGNVWEMCTEKMGKYKGNMNVGSMIFLEYRLWRGSAYTTIISSLYSFYQIIDYPNYCRGYTDVGFRIMREL